MLYHFGEHFWCPFRWQVQKFNIQVILNDFFDGQDPFTKSGGHARSLRTEVWNFAWDLVWPIHMPYKNTGSIREKKLIFGHPTNHIHKIHHKFKFSRCQIQLCKNVLSTPHFSWFEGLSMGGSAGMAVIQLGGNGK